MPQYQRSQYATERVDYSVDWEALLGTETISTSSWAVTPTAAGNTGSATITDDVTSTILIGINASCTLTNTIETSGGRILLHKFRVEYLG